MERNVEHVFKNGQVRTFVESWQVTTRAAAPGESAHLEATTIADLLADSKRNRISILKIDMEGAEAEVFAGECREWLFKVDHLAIELHGPVCR